MARPARAEREPELIADPITETITYIPGDSGRTSVTWCGLVFQANVPKEVTGRDGGTERERLHFHLITSARNNRQFQVGNARPKQEDFSEPKNAFEYRRYALAWIADKSIETADALIARFAKDRELRARCEVGTDDYDYLRDFFMPRLHVLSTVGELTSNQLQALWLSHGFNELPW